MTDILGISGSLRKASLNAALLRAAVDLMPGGATLDANGIEGVPLYNGDEEAAQGIPPAVAELKRKLTAADAQNAWMPVLRTLGTRPWFGGRLMVSRANTVIENGVLTDSATRDRLAEFLAGFVEFAGR